jgi:energy-coupling factor transporter ATP-binding protein EcfA2
LAAFLIAVLGARGTGKSTLARELQAALGREGRRVGLVDDTSAPTSAPGDRITAAALDHDLVVVDGPAPGANLHLLMALDLPGPDADAATRADDDAALRTSLQRVGASYSVITGLGPARHEAALACVRRALHPPDRRVSWHWVCERCGDAGCERHRLPRG